MAKANPKVLTIHPFGFQVGVFKSVKRYRSWFAKMDVDAPDVKRSNAAAVHIIGEDVSWFALILPDLSNMPKIAHECVHLADFAMEEAGVPTDASNTEVRGYIVESLMNQL